MKRRILAVLAASLAAASLSLAPAALAQQLKGDVRFLNGYPPGGTSDLLGRLMAEAIGPVVGQKVVVEQRTGASGFIAAEACAKAPADGHTIFLAPMGIMAVAPVMPGQKLTIDVDRDLTPISNLAGVYNILVVGSGTPFKTVAEVIDFAKKNPGKLTYASSGNGTSQHLSGELFKKLAGVDILHVPYRGGAPAILDMVGGRTSMMFGNMPEFLGQIKGGGLRPIAFGAVRPSPLFANLPVINSTLPDFKISNWFGVVGPAGLSPEWTAFWNRAINTIAHQPKFIQLMTDNGMELLAGTPEEFKATIAGDRRKWAEVIQAAKIRVD
ncbi:MAG: tripartite tricarboxylate transporter substrate binding protein [Betaproteobacteria bacterium]